MASGYGIADGFHYAEYVFDSTIASRSNSAEHSSVDWPAFLPGTPVNNVAALKILEVQIPFSYYVFTEKNNTFILLESPTAFAIPLTVTIPPGNYTADNFVSAASTALTDASAGAGGTNTTYQASFGFASKKITFATLDAPTGFYFKIYMKDPATPSQPYLVHPGPYIGYLDGVTYTSSTASYQTTPSVAGTTILTSASPRTQVFFGGVGQEVLLPLISTLVAADEFIIYNTGAVPIDVKTSLAVLLLAQPTATRVVYKVNGAGTGWIVGAATAYTGGIVPPEGQASLTAPNVMNLSGQNFIYLCSDALGSLVKLYLQKDNQDEGATGRELAKIPVDANSGNIIHWVDPDPAKWFDLDSLQTFSKLDFYFSIGVHGESTPLNFNGQGFSLKMGVLVGDANVTSLVGGGAQNNRVYKRTWQPSSIY